MDDLRTALAIIFKRKGKDHLTASEIIMSASMDYHWFDPENAKKLVTKAEELRLIRNDGGTYTPNFNYRVIEPTLDFSPGAEMLEKEHPKESIFPRILSEITGKYEITRQEFMKKVNRKKEDTCTDIEVAALLVLSGMRVDYSQYIGDIEVELKSRYT
jgi:hypothetical protein